MSNIRIQHLKIGKSYYAMNVFHLCTYWSPCFRRVDPRSHVGRGTKEFRLIGCNISANKSSASSIPALYPLVVRKYTSSSFNQQIRTRSRQRMKHYMKWKFCNKSITKLLEKQPRNTQRKKNVRLRCPVKSHIVRIKHSK